MEKFFEERPSIKKFTPGTDSFNTIRATYVNLDYEPSVIARPQTAEDVAAIVSYCVTNDIEFVVRSGGHDPFGRSTIAQGVQIDMRDIKHVDILPGRGLARIGGGVFNGRILEVLNAEGLTCATGTIEHIGFVGWATLGGYGPLSASLGLGVDQIVAAKVVNSKGNIVEADERMLACIRGAGGSLGVIVEATIKVYPHQEVQAGLLIYESSKLSQTVKTWFENYNQLLSQHPLPDNLYAQSTIIALPDLGNTFVVCFCWSGPQSEQFNDWADKIASLAPVLNNTITQTTQAAFVGQMSAVTPNRLFLGSCQSVSISGPQVTPEIIHIISRYAELKPREVGLVSLHTMCGLSTRSSLPIVFRNRMPHYMVEIVGLAITKDQAEAGRKWAEGFAADLRKADGALESSYLSLSAPETATPERVFGEEKLRFLLEVKREVDPKNVFKHSVPQLGL